MTGTTRRTLLIVTVLLASLATSGAASEAPDDFFTAQEIHEGGLGGEHGHWIIGSGPVGALIIRSRGVPGEHLSLGDRAQTVVGRLNRTLAIWEHRESPEAEEHRDDYHELNFEIDSSGEVPRVFFVPTHGAEPVLILSVSRGDEIGYDRRSPGYVGKENDRAGTDRNLRVTPELIARWWVALLTDVFRVVVLAERPTATAGTEAWPLLNTVREAGFRRQPAEAEHGEDEEKHGEDEAPHGEDEEEPERDWRHDLMPSERTALASLAQAVPANFR